MDYHFEDAIEILNLHLKDFGYIQNLMLIKFDLQTQKRVSFYTLQESPKDLQ